MSETKIQKERERFEKESESFHWKIKIPRTKNKKLSKISPFDTLWFSLVQNIKSGKEAEIFLLKNPQGEFFALKCYFPPEERTFRQSTMYTEGKFSKSFSEGKAIDSKGARGKKIAFRKWVQREYYLLKQASELLENIPKAQAIRDDKILMEYLWNSQEWAKKLADTTLHSEEAQKYFSEILHSIIVFWKELGIVHGDLSEFNILDWNHRPYIIDFPQALDIRNNPHAKALLERDIRSICNHFSQYFPINTQETLRKIYQSLLLTS
jgi:RIO kinase 1